MKLEQPSLEVASTRLTNVFKTCSAANQADAANKGVASWKLMHPVIFLNTTYRVACKRRICRPINDTGVVQFADEEEELQQIRGLGTDIAVVRLSPLTSSKQQLISC